MRRASARGQFPGSLPPPSQPGRRDPRHDRAAFRPQGAERQFFSLKEFSTKIVQMRRLGRKQAGYPEESRQLAPIPGARRGVKMSLFGPPGQFLALWERLPSSGSRRVWHNLPGPQKGILDKMAAPAHPGAANWGWSREKSPRRNGRRGDSVATHFPPAVVIFNLAADPGRLTLPTSRNRIV